MSDIDEALKKVKGEPSLGSGKKGTYYLHKLGKDTNGNWSYMVSRGANKPKKIQHQGEWSSKITSGDDIDKETAKQIISYYESFINESDAEYDKFVQDTLNKKGYESIADIPKDKIDDFWNEIDAGYNAKSEDGEDGVNESYAIAMLAINEGDTSGFISAIDEIMNNKLNANEVFINICEDIDKFNVDSDDEKKVDDEVDENNDLNTLDKMLKADKVENADKIINWLKTQKPNFATNALKRYKEKKEAGKVAQWSSYYNNKLDEETQGWDKEEENMNELDSIEDLMKLDNEIIKGKDRARLTNSKHIKSISMTGKSHSKDKYAVSHNVIFKDKQNITVYM